MYYCIIGIVSLIALCFLPMIGSDIGLAWKLPNTVVGWIVWVTTKIIVAVLNVLIFHCFMLQAKINIKDNVRYQEAQEILRSQKIKQIIPRSPTQWNKKQYTSKGVSIFITTALSTVALTQAILNFDWMSMLTYLFTIVMGLIFGIMQMKTAEDYWTDEYWQYAQMVQEQVELAEEKCNKQGNDSSSIDSGDNLLESSDSYDIASFNDRCEMVDCSWSDLRFLGSSINSSNNTTNSTNTGVQETIR